MLLAVVQFVCGPHHHRHPHPKRLRAAGVPGTVRAHPAQIEAGTPHDPASVAAALTQTGRAAGHRGTQLSRALSDATMAGGAPEAVGHYAITVVCAAYRRGFHAAANSLTEAAEQLPQDQLFPHLVSIGRAQRTATQRLADISSVLGQPPISRAGGKTETDTVKEQP